MKTEPTGPQLFSEGPNPNKNEPYSILWHNAELEDGNNKDVDAVWENPDDGVCSLEEAKGANSPEKGKLAKTEIVPIADIQFDEKQADEQLVAKLASSISAPWGQLLTPVIVSRLPEPQNGKQWLVRAGINRLVMAKKLGWQNITVSIVEGSDDVTKLLVLESRMIRRQLNAYQQMQNLHEWSTLLKSAHDEYKPGGDKAKKADSKKAQSLPNFDKLIETHTGLKKSSFYAKTQTFEHLQPEVRSFLEKNPKLSIANNARAITRVAKYKPDGQNRIVQHLKKCPHPEEAYFQSIREEKAAAAAALPEDKLFPIHHEEFSQNAGRIVDGSVDLILTDPNWFLAENDQEGKYFKLGAMKIAPHLTSQRWEEFVEIAAKKLNPNGHMAVMLGQQSFFAMSDIVRKHFNIRWLLAYVHGSGGGTAAREAYIASHWRPILLCRRKDAPPFTPEYTEYVHDVLPPANLITLHEDDPKALVELLRTEQELLGRRIACLEATGEDLLLNDSMISRPDPADESIMGRLIEGHALKKFHPWEQDVRVFRQIIRRLTKPGDFVWDPFIGSGTTGIAAVTCTERMLQDGKWNQVPAPRRGLGCEAMELWAGVAKHRVWEAKHSEPDSFESLDKIEASGPEHEKAENLAEAA
jgi:hypothetical protein